MARQIGEVLEDRYRLDAQLGQGAHGAVYRACDLRADRDVAVKLVRPRDDRERARVEREIVLIAALRDPHTVKLFTHGELADGTFYMVLELVEGQDLNELLDARGPLPPGVVVHISQQLLASLREAHMAGIVHRDVKPENIRVFSYAGDPHCVKLLDFGIARRPEANDSVTKTGELIGTPRYMAPEQLLSEPFTPASDLYSLGVVMLEMLVGREAIHGSSFGDQLQRMRTGHLLAVPETGSVPGLAEVIARMTARSPDDRYASAEAVLSALERAHHRKPAPAPRPARRARTATPRRVAQQVEPPNASRAVPWLIVAVAAALIACGIAVSYLAFSDETRPTTARRSEARVEAITKTIPQVTPPRVAPNGCDPAREVGSGVRWVDTEIGLGEYSWLQQVPQGYRPGHRHPLIVLLAREEMGERQFLDESGFRELADEVGAIVIVPKPDSTTLALASREGRIHEMVKRAAETLCVNMDRVFVVGHGSGGHGARRLSCEPWVAGAVEASARPDRATNCETPRPYVLMSPIRSPREPLEGGTNSECPSQHLLSLREHEGALRKRSGCDGEPVTRERVGKSVCHEWTCSRAPFMHCRIDGGSSWPGQQPRSKCDGDPSEFPAARTVWAFFERSVGRE